MDTSQWWLGVNTAFVVWNLKLSFEQLWWRKWEWRERTFTWYVDPVGDNGRYENSRTCVTNTDSRPKTLLFFLIFFSIDERGTHFVK